MDKQYILNNQLWGTSFNHKTWANIKLTNENLVIHMECEEKNPKAIYTKSNEPVYKDSCMEFFVKFDLESEYYLNFEMNANGTLLCQYGKDRKNRTFIDQSGLLVKANQKEESWCVDLFISIDFINKYSATFNKEILCNFYKCGDNTDEPHYVSWANILEKTPNFHCPKYFKKIKLGE